MLQANIENIAFDDISTLIESEFEESLTLDFKSSLPSSGTDARREFLYDIAAMANSGGGDILYGINDRRGGDDNQSTGIADGFSGMRLQNSQAEVARLENLIRDGIAPRLTGIQVRVLQKNQNDVLIIRVPRSWSGPHMVIFQAVNKFYARNSTGNYLMDVYQVGQSFAQQQAIGERLEEWRLKRIDRIRKHETPVRLTGNSFLVVHILPAVALFQPSIKADWNVPPDLRNELKLLSGSQGISRYNANGFMVHSYDGSNGINEYTQLYRNGALEYVNVRITTGQTNEGGFRLVSSLLLERALVTALNCAVNLLPELGFPAPLYVGAFLSGLKGKMLPGTGIWHIDPAKFEEDEFYSPDVVIESFDGKSPYSETLLPLVNSIWQAAGRERTPFEEGGVWKPFKNWP